jgi:hypothetical protein
VFSKLKSLSLVLFIGRQINDGLFCYATFLVAFSSSDALGCEATKNTGGWKRRGMGLFGRRKDRRSRKDRRTHLDPRYRNAVYPQFVDRRKIDRRETPYEDSPRLIREHPFRKWVVLIGVVIAAFLTYVFFFTCLIVSNKCPGERVRKRTITFGYYQDHSENQGTTNAYSGVATT